MRKMIKAILIGTLIFSMGISVNAEENKECTVTVDSVYATEGKTITMPVKISENPGFTNIAIAVDYDKDSLELISLNTNDDMSSYLCGSLVSKNNAWTDKDGIYAYLNGAMAEAVSEDGILFTVTFKTKEEFITDAAVRPVVQYIRNYDVDTAVFEEVEVVESAGKVMYVKEGDFSGDGEFNAFDLMDVVVAFNQKMELSDKQKAALNIEDNILKPVDLMDLVVKFNSK